MASSNNSSSVYTYLDESFVLASYSLLVFPLSLYVFYLGFLQWKSKRNDASWSVGHSDFSAYNLAVMELFGLAGSAVALHGKISNDVYAATVGSLVNKVPWSGQLLFPIFTCVEHYLAVVRPMTYLNMKRSNGILIRNASTAVVWLFACVGVSYVYAYYDSYKPVWIMAGVQMLMCLATVVFCCISVLHVLVQPKPGDESKGKFDKSKRRAVCVILAIMFTLIVGLVGNIILSALCIYKSFWSVRVGSLTHWLNHNSSVVLFLLYLKRAGKIPTFKRNPDSN